MTPRKVPFDNLMAAVRQGGLPALCTDNISAALDEKNIEIMQSRAQVAIEHLLDALLINWRNDHNMRDTPARVAKMLVNETFRGRYFPQPPSTDFPNVKQMDQLLAVGPIDVKATCAHHMLPFIGSAWIGVLPSKKSQLIGLSKFNRIVDHYARRPQIQEEMTSMIADALEKILGKPAGLIVMVRARHFCMCARGVNQNSVTTTNIARGKLKDLSLKQEFFNMIGDTSI